MRVFEGGQRGQFVEDVLLAFQTATRLLVGHRYRAITALISETSQKQRGDEFRDLKHRNSCNSVRIALLSSERNCIVQASIFFHPIKILLVSKLY